MSVVNSIYTVNKMRVCVMCPPGVLSLRRTEYIYV